MPNLMNINQLVQNCLRRWEQTCGYNDAMRRSFHTMASEVGQEAKITPQEGAVVANTRSRSPDFRTRYYT
jgi:hypothetical protein